MGEVRDGVKEMGASFLTWLLMLPWIFLSFISFQDQKARLLRLSNCVSQWAEVLGQGWIKSSGFGWFKVAPRSPVVRVSCNSIYFGVKNLGKPIDFRPFDRGELTPCKTIEGAQSCLGTKESRSKGWLQRWDVSLIYLQKWCRLWAVLVVFFKRNLFPPFLTFVKYMHHPLTSISPAFLVVFFSKNQPLGRISVMKVLECRKCLYLFGLEKQPKKQPNHGLFSRTFQGAVLQTEVGVDPFCAGIFTGWGSFVLDDGITRILYGGLKDFLCRKVIVWVGVIS